MANQALNSKRDQAAYLTKRANHKISRLRRTGDVEVAGSQYDPRKSKQALARYTEKQLDAYINRVSQFNDRSTQFVGDIKRRPIPAAEWRDYKRAEKAHRDHMLDRYNRIKDITLPGQDGKPGHETIAQRRDKMRADRRLAGNPTVNDPFDPPVRDHRNIKDRAALKTLLKDEKAKSRPGWDNKELKRQIGEFDKMIARVGDQKLADKIAKMGPQKFFVLWNGTGFANAVATEYEQMMLLLRGKEQPYHEQLVKDAFQDAHRLVDWAENLEFGEDKFITKQKKKAVNQYLTDRGHHPD